MILGALITGSEPANLFKKAFPHGGEMADIVLAPQQIRRPVGFEKGVSVAISKRASSVISSSWSKNATYSPAAIAAAALEAPAIPKLRSNRLI